MNYKIEKNGQKFAVNAESQEEAIAKVQGYFQEDKSEESDMTRGVVREFGEGVSLGWADEASSLVQSLLPETNADKIARQITGEDKRDFWEAITEDYTVFQGGAEEEMKKFRQENPGVSLAANVAGGLVTMAVPVGYAGLSAKGAGFGEKVRKAIGAGAVVGGAEGLVAGAGTAEMDGKLEGAAQGAAIGTLLGGTLAGGLTTAVSGFGGAASRVNKLIQDLGEEPAPVYFGAKKNKSFLETDDDIYEAINQKQAYDLMVMQQQGATTAELPSPVVMAVRTAKELGVDPRKALKVMASRGGRTDMSDLMPEDLMSILTGQLSKKKGNPLRTWSTSIDKVLDPLNTYMAKTVSQDFADRMTRGSNRAMFEGAKYEDDIIKPMAKVLDFLDGSSERSAALKSHMLNLARSNGDEIAEKKYANHAKRLIKAEFGDESVAAFDRYLDANVEMARRYARTVNMSDRVTRGWGHTQKLTDTTPESVADVFPLRRQGDQSAKMRTRGYIEADDYDQLAQYDNPLRTQRQWVQDVAIKMNISELFELPPAGANILGRAADDLAAKQAKAQAKYQGKRKGWNKAEVAAEEARLFEIQRQNLRLEGEDNEYLSDAMKKLAKADRNQAISGEAFYRSLDTRLRQDGNLSDEAIEAALDQTRSLIINSNKAMHKGFQTIRNIGYMGTIGNPYGAAMNAHDIFNSMYKFGIRNTLQSLTGRQLSVEDLKIARQVVGEFTVKDGKKLPGFFDKTQEVSDQYLTKAMEWSGFGKMDRLGKNIAINAALKKGIKEVGTPSWRNSWKHTFNEVEMNKLQVDLANGDTSSDLVREYLMFELSKMQPINAAQQTKFALDNPNARMFYMLKGFAIRQLDMLRNDVIRQYKAGNKKEAMTNAMRYALLSGGGYGLVQETRQLLKWEQPEYQNVPAHVLNNAMAVATLGVLGNDYSNTKFMENPGDAFLQGMMPPVNLLQAPIQDMFDLLNPDSEVKWETLKNLPIIGKSLVEPILED